MVGLDGPGGESPPQPLEAASDAPVDESIADPDDDTAEDRRVDVRLEGHAVPGQLLEAGRDRANLLVAERDRAGGGGVGQSIARVVAPGELGGDPRQLLDPAAPNQQEDQVADGLAELGEAALGGV